MCRFGGSSPARTYEGIVLLLCSGANGALACGETVVFVAAVAERLCLRAPAAAQRDILAHHLRVFVPVAIREHDSSRHQIGAVLADLDPHFAHTLTVSLLRAVRHADFAKRVAYGAAAAVGGFGLRPRIFDDEFRRHNPGDAGR